VILGRRPAVSLMWITAAERAGRSTAAIRRAGTGRARTPR
jgi:hypothetical protein